MTIPLFCNNSDLLVQSNHVKNDIGAQGASHGTETAKGHATCGWHPSRVKGTNAAMYRRVNFNIATALKSVKVTKACHNRVHAVKETEASLIQTI